ncbi:hypothetical protein [Nonomuraea sp. NPDC052265]|uniref:hypothetical protein n=1 Tax=Nonomuraea sp. NPDC052265 TaxID=3364374 RepID=UPI0037C626C4
MSSNIDLPATIEVEHAECGMRARYVIPEGRYSWFQVCIGCGTGIVTDRANAHVTCEGRRIDIDEYGVSLLDCTNIAVTFVPHRGHLCLLHGYAAITPDEL